VREAAQHLYFLGCLAAGRLLRGARYSKAEILEVDGQRHVRKHRRFYAPLLVWAGEPLVRVLNTGSHVLPQPEWEKREGELYQRLYNTSIRVDPRGALVLPFLEGETLASLLENPSISDSVRETAIELAVKALTALHELGFTHGDAMAENVMIDLDSGAAHWFDFETIHDQDRSLAWRRSDDVRALLATSLARTVPGKLAETLHLILDTYGDETVTGLVAASFGVIVQRPLTFHLGQAGLPFRYYREIDRLLATRGSG
jgi:serine/threonine protein kinase